MNKFFERGLAREFALSLIFFSILGAVFLAVLVHDRPVLLTDIKISNEVQESSIIPLLPIMEFVSVFGNPPVTIFITLLIATIFYMVSRRREAIFILLTFVADAINGLIKLIIHRPRPSDTIITVYQKFTDSSFPSGHVVHYTVFFGFLVILMIMLNQIPKILRVLVASISIILILLVSVSRIYLGAHWATDVVGGYLVGFILFYSLAYLYFKKDFLNI